MGGRSVGRSSPGGSSRCGVRPGCTPRRQRRAHAPRRELPPAPAGRQLRDDRSFVVDCLDYRKGKDAELRQMTRFMMEKAKNSGTAQEMGPLNPYARRLVHLTVAEDATMASESIGDAFMKTVIIATKK